MTTYNIALITIGRGGHTAYMIGDGKYHGSKDHPVRLSGYATAETVLSDMANLAERTGDTYVYSEGCAIVDLTTMDSENLVKFACSGPMVNPFLPDNTVRGLGKGTVQWDGGNGELTGNYGSLIATTHAGINAIMGSGDTIGAMCKLSDNPDGSIFGNAGSMDDVSRDVYVKLALAFGATVTPIS